MKRGQLGPAYLQGHLTALKTTEFPVRCSRAALFIPPSSSPLPTHHKYDVWGQPSPLRSHSPLGVAQPPRLYHFQASLPGALNSCQLPTTFPKKIVSPCDPH